MFQIDFLSFFNDSKLKETLHNVLKEKSNLNNHDIEKFIENRIKYHGDKMTQQMQNYVKSYSASEQDINQKNEIDQKLDEMINSIKLENKKFESVE